MFKLGADPEMFLKDAMGAFVSSIGKIGGSKDQPRPLPIGDGFAIQEDNVSVEYNIPPAESKEMLQAHINKVLTHIKNEVEGMGLHITDESAVSFPPEQLIDPAALVFGCDPDYNAWLDGAINPRPKADDWKLRSCGGHVHVGYQFKDKHEKMTFIKFMDLFLGVPSTRMDNGLLRKQLYGKWGAYRDKPYGVEYRVLSNYWTFDPALVGWVWDATDLALKTWQTGNVNIDEDRRAIEAAINHSHLGAVEYLSKKHNLLYV